jgi:multidrug efflux pump subunit AcrA (membrane-fusion protein)
MFDRSLFAAALFLALGGCNRNSTPTNAAATAAATPITLVKPERKVIERVIEQPGAVMPSEETKLFAKFPGFVKTIGVDVQRNGEGKRALIDIGSKVIAGQLLAELAIPELQQEAKQKAALVRQSEAEVEQARKGLISAEAGVASAKAMVAEANAGLSRGQALYDRWKSEADRMSGLVRGGVIDNQTRDETLNQFKAAEATRNEAVAKVATAEADVRKSDAARGKAIADIAAAEAELEVAKAGVSRVNALLSYTKITAPYDGVVTQRSINTGDFLSGNGKEGVFSVARLDPVRVVAQVPEADAGLIAEGLPVRLTVQSLPGKELRGTVARTSWSLEPGSRTLRTEIDLPNKDAAVRPGMYVYTRITAPLPAAWAVPATAVGKFNDEPVVYFVADGKAERTSVQVLRGDGKFTQLHRYKKSGAVDWTDFNGSESIASPASALTDGQSLPARDDRSDRR